MILGLLPTSTVSVAMRATLAVNWLARALALMGLKPVVWPQRVLHTSSTGTFAGWVPLGRQQHVHVGVRHMSDDVQSFLKEVSLHA